MLDQSGILQAHRAADDFLLTLMARHVLSRMSPPHDSIRSLVDLMGMLHDYHCGSMQKDWSVLRSHLLGFASVRSAPVQLGNDWFASAHEAIDSAIGRLFLETCRVRELYGAVRRHIPPELGWGGDEGFNQIGFKLVVQTCLTRAVRADDAIQVELNEGMSVLASLNRLWTELWQTLDCDQQVRRELDQVVSQMRREDQVPLRPGSFSVTDGDRLAAESRIEYAQLATRSGASHAVTASRVPDPVSTRAAAVYELLSSLPRHRAMTGPELLDALAAKHIFVDQGTLTGRIIPELEPYGVKNIRRIGYFVRAGGRGWPADSHNAR